MSNYNRNHKKSNALNLFILVMVLLAGVAVACAITQGFTNGNPYGWFNKKASTEEVVDYGKCPVSNGDEVASVVFNTDLSTKQVNEIFEQLDFDSVPTITVGSIKVKSILLFGDDEQAEDNPPIGHGIYAVKFQMDGNWYNLLCRDLSTCSFSHGWKCDTLSFITGTGAIGHSIRVKNIHRNGVWYSLIKEVVAPVDYGPAPVTLGMDVSKVTFNNNLTRDEIVEILDSLDIEMQSQDYLGHDAQQGVLILFGDEVAGVASIVTDDVPADMVVPNYHGMFVVKTVIDGVVYYSILTNPSYALFSTQMSNPYTEADFLSNSVGPGYSIHVTQVAAPGEWYRLFTDVETSNAPGVFNMNTYSTSLYINDRVETGNVAALLSRLNWDNAYEVNGSEMSFKSICLVHDDTEIPTDGEPDGHGLWVLKDVEMGDTHVDYMICIHLSGGLYTSDSFGHFSAGWISPDVGSNSEMELPSNTYTVGYINQDALEVLCWLFSTENVF